MVKKEIIKSLKGKFATEGIEISDKKLEKLLGELVCTILDGLNQDGEACLGSFGKFVVKTKAGRNGINPQTLEKIRIEEKKVIQFKPSKKIKSIIKEL